MWWSLLLLLGGTPSSPRRCYLLYLSPLLCGAAWPSFLPVRSVASPPSPLRGAVVPHRPLSVVLLPSLLLLSGAPLWHGAAFFWDTAPTEEGR